MPTGNASLDRGGGCPRFGDPRKCGTVRRAAFRRSGRKPVGGSIPPFCITREDVSPGSRGGTRIPPPSALRPRLPSSVVSRLPPPTGTIDPPSQTALLEPRACMSSCAMTRRVPLCNRDHLCARSISASRRQLAQCPSRSFIRVSHPGSAIGHRGADCPEHPRESKTLPRTRVAAAPDTRQYARNR